ncbi:low temperature requirement protein A [Streptosporangium lutulentum]
MESAPAETELRVSTLELFFDLVFVFTVTQLTNLLVQGLQDGRSFEGHCACSWCSASSGGCTRATPG